MWFYGTTDVRDTPPKPLSEIVRIPTFPTIFLPVRQKKPLSSPKTPSGNHQNEPGYNQIDPTSDIVPSVYKARCVMRAGHITNYVYPPFLLKCRHAHIMFKRYNMSKVVVEQFINQS